MPNTAATRLIGTATRVDANVLAGAPACDDQGLAAGTITRVRPTLHGCYSTSERRRYGVATIEVPGCAAFEDLVELATGRGGYSRLA